MKPHVVLRSPLAPAEAEEALRAAISDPPPTWLELLFPPFPDLFAKRGTKWFVGTVRDGRIRVRMRVQFGVASGGGLRPWFRGRLVPDGGGSRLEGEFCIASSTLVGFAPTFLVLLLFLVMGIRLLVVGNEAFPDARIAGAFIVAFVVAAALWGRCILFIGRQFDDGEEVLRRFLELHLRVTHDGPQPGPSSRAGHENAEVPLQDSQMRPVPPPET